MARDRKGNPPAMTNPLDIIWLPLAYLLAAPIVIWHAITGK